MPDPRDAYDLEPDKSKPSDIPPGPPPAVSPASKPAPGKAKIDSPGLLEGFEEDADFDKDPELERVITGKADRPASLSAPAAVDDRPEFGTPLAGQAVHWAIAGGVLLVGAMIATGINAPNRTFLRIVLALYTACLHTGTGVVAVYVAAILTGTKVKSLELTAARIFTAVAAFLFIFRLNINLFGADYRNWRVEELLLATLVYVGIIAAGFRLLQRQPLLILIGAHFILWMVVQVGMELARSVGETPKPAEVRAPAEPPRAPDPVRP